MRNPFSANVGRLAAYAAAFLVLSACTNTRAPSPLGEMMAANARGEVACVRHGVLVSGREKCK